MITTVGLHALVGLFGDTDTPVDFTYIAYGSGTTAVTAGDTTLETEIGRHVAIPKIKSILHARDTISFSYDFIIPTTAGTVSEIGVFTASSGGTMLLRELISPVVTYRKGATVSVAAEVTVKNDSYGVGASW
jgi:hypothetical protein